MDQKHQFRFFSHTKCEYFPCHAGADPERFNCLFCYCPLYALGNRCGGQFTYTPEGFKDCSSCLLPHRPEGYDRIMARWPDLLALTQAQQDSES